MIANREQQQQYPSDFIKIKRGVEAVAAETGINRQTVRQLFNKRNGASPATLDKFEETYPDFDRNKADKFSIEENSPVMSTVADSLPVHSNDIMQMRVAISELKALYAAAQLAIADMKQQLTEAKEEIREWQNAYRYVTEHAMGFDKEHSKIGSDSHTTDYRNFRENPAYRPAGYHAETLQKEALEALA